MQHKSILNLILWKLWFIAALSMLMDTLSGNKPKFPVLNSKYVALVLNSVSQKLLSECIALHKVCKKADIVGKPHINYDINCFHSMQLFHQIFKKNFSRISQTEICIEIDIVSLNYPVEVGGRDQRVPDTRPEPEIFFNTRSVPD